MENFNEVNLSRRNFVKGVLAASGAVALAAAAPAVKPFEAFAAEGDETYTVTANLYVDSTDSPIKQNAYVTNSGKPPLHKPTSPVSDNATLVVKADGTKLLTVPIVNTTFGVTSFPWASKDGSVVVTDQVTEGWNTTWGGSLTRVSSITFDITKFSADGSTIATFSPCVEFADFLLYKGAKDWDLHLVADCTSISA